MRAHMHQSIGLEAMTQPKPEGDQRMARRKRRVVIGGAAIVGAPAVGRQRDQHAAEARGAEAERAIAAIWIVGRIAPCRIDPFGDGFGQLTEQASIILQG